MSKTSPPTTPTTPTIDDLVTEYQDATVREHQHRLLSYNAANDRAVALEKMWKTGMSYIDIGAKTGLSGTRVGQMVRKLYQYKPQPTKT